MNPGPERLKGDYTKGISPTSILPNKCNIINIEGEKL